MTATQSVAREVTVANVPSSDGRALLHLDTLTTEVGWLLVTAGVIGVITPGIPEHRS